MARQPLNWTGAPMTEVLSKKDPSQVVEGSAPTVLTLLSTKSADMSRDWVWAPKDGRVPPLRIVRRHASCSTPSRARYNVEEGKLVETLTTAFKNFQGLGRPRRFSICGVSDESQEKFHAQIQE